MFFRLIVRDAYQISPNDWNTFCQTFDVHVPLALTAHDPHEAERICRQTIGVVPVNFNADDLPKEFSEAGMIYDAVVCAGSGVRLLAMAAKKIDQNSKDGSAAYATVAEAAEKMNEAVQALHKLMKETQGEE